VWDKVLWIAVQELPCAKGLSQKVALGMRHMAASNMLHAEVQVVGQKLGALTMKPQGTGLAISALLCR